MHRITPKPNITTKPQNPVRWQRERREKMQTETRAAQGGPALGLRVRVFAHNLRKGRKDTQSSAVS